MGNGVEAPANGVDVEEAGDPKLDGLLGPGSSCGGGLSLQADEGFSLGSEVTAGEVEEAVDFSAEVDDYKDVKGPRWLFDTAVLYERLRPLAEAIQKKDEPSETSVFVRYVDGKVELRFNAETYKGSVRIPILNDTEPIQGKFIISFNVLLSIVRNSGAKFMLWESQGGLRARVLGGEMEFDQFTIEEKHFDLPEVLPAAMTLIQAPQLVPALIRGAASMALSVRPDDRRARVTDGTMYTNFYSSVFIQRKFPIPTISFKARDLVILSRLFAKATQIYVSVLDTEWNYFQSPDVRIYVTKTDTQDLQATEGIVAAMKKVQTMSVSSTHLSKVVGLLRAIVGGTGTLQLMGRGGRATVETCSRTGKAFSFEIARYEGDEEFVATLPMTSIGSMTNMYKGMTVLFSVASDKSVAFEGEDSMVYFGSV